MEVGFRHSGNVQMDQRNALAMCTDGTLINMIEKGELDHFSAVMIDEAHERSKNIDLILRLLKERLPLYPHLKVLIASATIDSESFLRYFGKKTATIINFESKRKYNYTSNKNGEPTWRDESVALPYKKGDLQVLMSTIASDLAKQIFELLEGMDQRKNAKGDILAFLPGMRTIDDAVKKFRRGRRKPGSYGSHA